MNSNKNFRKHLAIGTLIVIFCVILVSAIGNRAQNSEQNTVRITILHTNDTHSQVVPQDRNNMGGFARRLGVINQIRAEEQNVLLIDACDFFQGTPFFNFFSGVIEIEAFNRMAYDVVGVGNHEFDKGVDNLAERLRYAEFAVVNSNYLFENEFLAEKIQRYFIKEMDGIRIGFLGLGIDLEGLVSQDKSVGVSVLDQIAVANEVADFLRYEKNCDLIIAVTHLGVNPLRSATTDIDVAQNTRNIDIIIGGHSHDILENRTEKNLDGRQVIIAQAGRSGFYLGRIDLELERR
jgi:5'-nucleotidase